MATEIKKRRSELTRVGGPYPPIPSADDNFGISQATRHRTNKRRWTDQAPRPRRLLVIPLHLCACAVAPTIVTEHYGPPGVEFYTPRNHCGISQNNFRGEKPILTASVYGPPGPLFDSHLQ